MERLIEYFVPSHYDLELRINKYTETVQGHARIEGSLTDLSKSRKELKLHSKYLKITSLEIDGKKAEFELVPKEEIVLVKLPSAAKSTVSLDFKYTFKLSHNMEGAYLSTYEYKGKEERIVVTQFESHYAREVFPSVDEPAAKATFALKIIDTEPEDTILSNMPIKSERVLTYDSVDPDESPEGGVSLSKKVSRKIVEFETTPKMSTYLLAFALGRFNKQTTTNNHGVVVTTYTALNQSKSMLDFPNQIAADTLDLYDELFGVDYPLPKLDQVAIPDFEAGAMENWGLVTYREACLLADKSTTQSDREYIATVITHELSHQWFGNLVTMKWWNNLWLNESFANMMQYVAADKLHPEWHVWQDFFTSDCYYALRRDSLPGVQSVQQEVNDPAEIATLFDSAIVYAKGAHLMFMLMRLMGEKKFFAGLKAYFKKHKYSNTTGDDLWASLQPYASFDVKEFMDAWILQSGYPMLTDNSQQRFMLTGATDDSRWPLPKITDDMSGHYIINLSAKEFEDKLSDFDNLSLEQRLRLLIDRELLAQTPLVSAGSLVDLLPKFREETSEPVWEILADIISLLKIFCLPDTEYYELYQAFVYNLLEPNLARLGLETKAGEDDSETKLRSILLGFAIYSEHQETIENLAQFYDDDFSKLDSETRSSVIIAKLRAGHEEIFDRLVERYARECDPGLKSDLLGALTSAREPENVEKLVRLLEEPKVVRPQDHAYLLAYLLNNFHTRKSAFDWFYSHWDYIKTLTSDKSMDDYIRIVAARVRTDEEFARFNDFCEPMKDEPNLARSIEVGRTDILARLRWLKSDAEAVRKRLR